MNEDPILTYVGIADAHGIESFLPDDTKAKTTLYLRAMYNRQRHAVYYQVTMHQSDVNIVTALIERKQYIEALLWIKSHAVTVGFPVSESKQFENSWQLIPNDQLDPMFS